MALITQSCALCSFFVPLIIVLDVQIFYDELNIWFIVLLLVSPKVKDLELSGSASDYLLRCIVRVLSFLSACHYLLDLW